MTEKAKGPAKPAASRSRSGPPRPGATKTREEIAARRDAEANARHRLKSGAPIVPRETVSGQTLSVVIAIMAFLACLAVGGVTVVANTADSWQNDVAREVTIQIRPSDSAEMDAAVREASRLVLGFEGIARVTALDDESSARLLEPWLGKDLDLSELPIPKLLIVSVKEGSHPDFEAISNALSAKVPGAVLDDHRAWMGRLTRMSWAMIGFGIGILVLVLTATVFTVVFATRGAMSGSGEIIDVLHYVGAEPRFIARQFQRHFMVLGLRGALAGSIFAIIIFASLGIWTSWNRATPEGDQISALFGTFGLGWHGYAGILAIAVTITLLTVITSHITVRAHVNELEVYTRKR